MMCFEKFFFFLSYLPLFCVRKKHGLPLLNEAACPGGWEGQWHPDLYDSHTQLWWGHTSNAVLGFGPLATRKRGHRICSVKGKEAVKGLEHNGMGSSWGNCNCSICRRGGSGVTLLLPTAPWKEFVVKWGVASLPRQQQQYEREWPQVALESVQVGY